MCWPWDVKCHAENVADGFIGDIQKAIASAVSDVVSGVSTLWMKVPSPNFGKVANGTYEPSSVVGFINSHVAYYAAGLAVISVLITAGRMAWERKGTPLREGLASLLKLLLVSGAGLAATSLALQAGDSFSTWIINESLGDGQDFGKAMESMMGTSSGAPMIVIISGIFAIIGGFIQVALMVMRTGLSYVLGGTLVLAWAATNTAWGKNWAQKHTGWLIALVLYKPAASIIYAAAFKTTSSGFTGELGDANATRWVGMITGLILLFMAIVALPAIAKFIVPAVGAMGGGGGGMFMGAAAGAVASGAVNAGRGGSKSGGGSGAAAPSGGGGGRSGGGGSSGPAGGAVLASSPGAGSAGAGGAARAGGAAGAGAATAAKAAPPVAAASAVTEGAKAVKGGADAARGAVESQTGPGGGSGSHDPAATPGAGAGPDGSKGSGASKGSTSGNSSAAAGATAAGSTTAGQSSGAGGTQQPAAGAEAASGAAGADRASSAPAAPAAGAGASAGAGPTASGSGAASGASRAAGAASAAGRGASRGANAGKSVEEKTANEIEGETPSGSRE